MRREKRIRLFFCHVVEQRIADHAPREKLSRRLEPERRDQRRELIERTIARDLHRPCRSPLAQQVPVSREQDAILRVGEAYELRVVQRGIVECVKPEHAKPPSESPEHGVSDKPWRS
jgi:hypothetical protein